MRARSWAGSDVPSWGTARPAAPATSAASSANRFMAQNIHASALMAGRRRLITFPLVSEFVFGTHNAAFVQVMYEQYLRDPASVSDDWRQLFDNGRSEEHTSELQSRLHLVCRLLLEKKKELRITKLPPFHISGVARPDTVLR